MSPSRGGARAWSIAATTSSRTHSSSAGARNLRPVLHAASVCPRAPLLPPARFHTSAPRLLSASLSYAQEEEAPQDHSGIEHRLPQPADTSLFESSTEEYDEFVRLDQHHDADADASSSQQQPLRLLRGLINSDIRAANRALHELNVLRTTLAPHTVAIRAALDSLQVGDIEACHAWVELFPVATKLHGDEVASSDHAGDARHLKDVERLLLRLVEVSEATPADVSRILVKLVQRGFLVERATQRTIGQVFAWVLRSAKPPSAAARVHDDRKGKQREVESTSAWTWHLWNHIVQAARSSLLASASSDESAVDASLARLYNRAIRTFALADRLDTALWWIGQSSSVSPSDKGVRDEATALQVLTLTLVAKKVFNDAAQTSLHKGQKSGRESSTMTELIAIQDKIYARAAEEATKDKSVDKSESQRLRDTLERQIGRLEQSIGAVAGGKEQDDMKASVLDRMLLKRANRRDIAGAWNLLRTELGKHRRGKLDSSMDHLPSATTLAVLLDMAEAHAQDRKRLEDESDLFELPPDQVRDHADNCIFRLHEGTRGGIGLVQTAEMLRLVNKGDDRAAVELFRSIFVQTADVQAWMRAVLGSPSSFRPTGDSVQEKEDDTHFKRLVWPGTHPKHILLRALVRLCESDTAKLTSLYHSFLDSLDEVFEDSTAAAKEQGNDQQEEAIDDDLAITKILEGLSFGNSSYPSTTSHSFDLFLKYLVDSIAATSPPGADRKTAPAYSFAQRREHETKVRQCRLRANAKLAEILADMRRLKVEPSVASWTIVLQNLALGSSDSSFASRKLLRQGRDTEDWEEGAEVDEGTKKTGVWNLARALGMDPDQRSSRTMSSAGAATATLATYLALMKGFLGVPVSQGGPLLNEARRVREWMLRTAIQNEQGTETDTEKAEVDIEAKIHALSQSVADHQHVHDGRDGELLAEQETTRAPKFFTLDDIGKNVKARKTLAWLAEWESSADGLEEVEAIQEQEQREARDVF
ncbi:hypothetical protein FA10DRAFT_265243 [Acaromyces ingoldii]|uniref:Uncharacterized protein n=1 Tax=Acaromyces ingoldii TaxID=215250 RepID=A0A316YRE0_9BASI|nr:hypothetical protein FA10DRAFT_265243 [Acaromyces ingoldii]PWN91384.1 hypothetical protein FA10DRAFT_265243 [Acaromyces ingoldii]